MNVKRILLEYSDIMLSVISDIEKPVVTTSWFKHLKQELIYLIMILIPTEDCITICQQTRINMFSNLNSLYNSRCYHYQGKGENVEESQ